MRSLPKAISWNKRPFSWREWGSTHVPRPRGRKGQDLLPTLHANGAMPSQNVRTSPARAAPEDVPAADTCSGRTHRSHAEVGASARLLRGLRCPAGLAARSSLRSTDQNQAVIVPAALGGKPHSSDQR